VRVVEARVRVRASVEDRVRARVRVEARVRAAHRAEAALTVGAALPRLAVAATVAATVVAAAAAAAAATACTARPPAIEVVAPTSGTTGRGRRWARVLCERRLEAEALVVELLHPLPRLAHALELCSRAWVRAANGAVRCSEPVSRE
jgi:hypothetical protein